MTGRLVLIVFSFATGYRARMVRTLLLLLALLVGTAAAGSTARVPVETARKTALARVPGKVLKEKLNDKKKYEHLVWSIKVQTPNGTIKKVIVDADNGKVIEVKVVQSKDKKKDDDD